MTAYPLCLNGNTTYITTENDGNFDVSEITATLKVAPLLVIFGKSANIRWASTETASCSVTADTNSDSWSGRYGEKLSSPISNETTYTLSCIGYDDSVITDTATVRIVPKWQEF